MHHDLSESQMHLLGGHTISFHTITDHNFLEPKVQVPEPHMFSSKTTHFQTKIQMGDEDHFRVILKIDCNTQTLQNIQLSKFF